MADSSLLARQHPGPQALAPPPRKFGLEGTCFGGISWRARSCVAKPGTATGAETTDKVTGRRINAAKAKQGRGAAGRPATYGGRKLRSGRIVWCRRWATASKKANGPCFGPLPSSRRRGCSPCKQPLKMRDTPDEVTSGRALCGKIARTVRGGAPLPGSYRGGLGELHAARYQPSASTFAAAARSAGSASAVNHGWRRSQPLVRQDGWGRGK